MCLASMPLNKAMPINPHLKIPACPPPRLLTSYPGALFPLFLLVVFLLFSMAWGSGAQAQEECSGSAVCNAEILPASRSPGLRTSYELSFVTPEEISGLTESIVMELHQDIRVPQTIDPAGVRIEYRKGNDRALGAAADVSLTNEGNPNRPTTIKLTHEMKIGDSLVDVPPGAEVTITFTREAGIANPTEGGAFFWRVGVGAGDTLVDANHPDRLVRQAFRQASVDGSDMGLLVDRMVALSKEEIGRGQKLTATGRGYLDGFTLTVWRDANINGQRDGDETVLCQTLVREDGVGSCTLTVSVPPFVAAFGECVDADTIDCNFINAAVGSGGSSIVTGKGTRRIFDSGQVVELVGRIRVDTVQGPGGNIRLEVIDFPAGVITSVTIGRVPAEIEQFTVGPSGRLSFKVPVPNDASLGRQYLRVELLRRDNGEVYAREIIVDIDRPHAVVRMVPQTAVANQRVALSGERFSAVDGTSISEVLVDSFAVDSSRIDSGSGSIAVASNGTWAGSLALPVIEATTTPGIHTIRVKDSLGRAGSVEFTVPARKVTVAPEWGRPGGIVRVSGRGFPGRNDEGSNLAIRIFYDSSEGLTQVPAETDIHGNFTQDIRIPLMTSAPSSNLVRVEFDDDQGVTVATTVAHELPGPVLELGPASGPPGTTVTLSGSGFRSFVPVAQVRFGSIDVSPGTMVMTDTNGKFATEFTVPGLEAGIQIVRATAADLEASATFELTPSGVVPGAALPAARALEGLGHRLVTVFHFNNDTKEWTFFDPELEEYNTLEFVVAGETYLILVSETTEAMLNGRRHQLSCLGGNCWNQIVW